MHAAFENEIEALERKYADTPPGNLVFYGSSSIRLWPGLSRTFPAVQIENWGFGGSTLATCAYFFERLIVPRAPRGIVFYGGDNDLFLGAKPINVWESLNQMMELRENRLSGVPFAFIALKPSPARAHLLETIIEANEWCRREIAGREDTHWVEVFEPMVDAARQPRTELFLGDQLHLSRAGYDLWNEVLKREVPWLSQR